METAEFSTKVQITLEIIGRIDARTYSEKDLLEDWIYCQVTDHNSEWKKVEILKEELTDFDQI